MANKNESPKTRPCASDQKQLVADAFAALVDATSHDNETTDVFDLLARECVRLLDVDAASVLLDTQRPQWELAAATSVDARVLGLLQMTNGRGPSVDCIKTGIVVSVDDMSQGYARWAEPVQGARDAQLLSIAAIPIQRGAKMLAVLNLFARNARQIGAVDIKLVRALAEVAAIGITNRRLVTRRAHFAEQMQYGLSSRVLVEQAKGITAGRNNVNMDAAFDALSNAARTQNLNLADVARLVISSELDPRTVMTVRRTRVR